MKICHDFTKIKISFPVHFFVYYPYPMVPLELMNLNLNWNLFHHLNLKFLAQINIMIFSELGLKLGDLLKMAYVWTNPEKLCEYTPDLSGIWKPYVCATI